MTRKKKQSLPQKLSDLLELALEDACAIAATPGYVLEMSNWHVPLYSESGDAAKRLGVKTEKQPPACSVCMAGAVMARTLGANPKLRLVPGSFDEEICERLSLIDGMREGCFILDQCVTGPQRVALFDATNVVQSRYDYSTGLATAAAYRKAIRILRKAGL